MCGIAGIVGLRGIEEPERLMRRMTDSMAHRGPDAAGVWSGKDVVLGHRRLSIIDLSRDADQPFHSSDGRYVLVFNGEIYNYRELRTELKHYAFRTNCDTEVLLAAFAQWGMDMLPRLQGMFALAIHDTQEDVVILARDRIGIKPLYYHLGDDRILFASELRALLATELVPRKLDEDALVDMLRYQTVHAPETLVADIKMLPPGHWMRVDAEEVEFGRWWEPVKTARPDLNGISLAVIQKEVRTRLRRAVERRLVSDVPFGAFLSGGIDSSAIVGLMAELNDGPVHTFSVTFDESEFSEARYAQAIAKRFRTEHTEIRLRPDDMLRYLPDALASMDHPSGDGPNTWVVSKVTKEAGITMALSGTGGDELFAGYEVFTRSLRLWDQRWATQFPMPLRKLAGAVFKTFRPGIRSTKAAELLRAQTFSIDDTYPLSRLAFTDKELQRLVRRKDLPVNSVRAIMHRVIREDEGYRLPFLSQVSVGEMNTYLPNVLLRDTDRMSMAHALEVRVPFLDHELVEYVLGVPDDLKYPHGPKQLLVSSLGDLLPDSIVNRPKMGFTLPWEKWMRTELRSYCEARLQSLGTRSQFNPKGISAAWTEFLSGSPHITWSRIWILVVLEDWLQQNKIS